MPSLVICGNRTFVAGDDLRTFTFFAIVLRLLQIAVLIPYTVVTGTKYDVNEDLVESCGGDSSLRTLIDKSYIIFMTFLCSSYITTLGGLAIEIGIWQTSAKGTPTEPEKRARLQPLCRIKMIPMTVFRIANMALGIILIDIMNQICWCGGTATDPYVNCPALDELNLYQAILTGTYFLEAAVVGCMGFYFLCKARSGYPALITAKAK